MKNKNILNIIFEKHLVYYIRVHFSFSSDIQQEKKSSETHLRNSIEGFPKDGLKKADTNEKNTLPTKEGRDLISLIKCMNMEVYCELSLNRLVRIN